MVEIWFSRYYAEGAYISKPSNVGLEGHILSKRIVGLFIDVNCLK